MSAGVMGTVCWVVGALVLGVGVGVSSGQELEGVYTTSEGLEVGWEVDLMVEDVDECNCTCGPPVNLEAIEGVERELEGGEVSEGAGAQRAVDLARLFLKGRFSGDEIRAHVLGCTDPLCAHYAIPDDGAYRVAIEGAIGAYGVHLEQHPEDWIAAREFGVALLAGRRASEAVAVVADVYAREPEIGLIPVNPGLFGKDRPRALRELVVRAVKHAQREGTGEAWLLVAVLMQSEGRTDRAMQMLDRAIGFGLDPEVGAGLARALGGNP